MTSKPIRLPCSIIIAIKRDLKVGRTYREICSTHHVSNATIVAVRDLKTIPTTDQFYRDESSWPCKHSPEKLQMIKKARKAGKSVKEIAEIFEISQSYVSNIMNGRERSAER